MYYWDFISRKGYGNTFSIHMLISFGKKPLKDYDLQIILCNDLTKIVLVECFQGSEILYKHAHSVKK